MLIVKLMAGEEPSGKGMLEPHSILAQLISLVSTRPVEADLNVPVMFVVRTPKCKPRNAKLKAPLPIGAFSDSVISHPKVTGINA